ncbi:MAG: hypothetical protein HY270_18920, partial [Deltaproteobacteria bacterium]|nr:hypothetical protein [Deltaproteobacteria bacterium]
MNLLAASCLVTVTTPVVRLLSFRAKRVCIEARRDLDLPLLGLLMLLLSIVSWPTNAFSQVSGQSCDANIVLMLDRTGSMSATDLANEQAAAKSFLGVAANATVPPLIAIGGFG